MSEKDERNRKHYVRAAYAPDGPGAAYMILVLKENGIDAYQKGGVRDIYRVGGDIFGEEIMVAPENLSRSQELLEQTAGVRPVRIRKRSSVRNTVICLIAALILLVILLVLRGKFLA